MTGRRRVVITGVGAVTPIGTGADGLWRGLQARRSAVQTLTRFDPAPFRSHIAAEIPDFRPQDHLDAKRAKRLDRFSQLAVTRSEEHTSELQSLAYLVCRLLLEKKNDPTLPTPPTSTPPMTS